MIFRTGGFESLNCCFGKTSQAVLQEQVEKFSIPIPRGKGWMSILLYLVYLWCTIFIGSLGEESSQSNLVFSICALSKLRVVFVSKAFFALYAVVAFLCHCFVHFLGLFHAN